MTPRISVSAGLRFEIFYAMQLVAENTPRAHGEWQRATRRALGPAWLRASGEVAPHPIFWPLIADVLVTDRADIGFDELADGYASMRPDDMARGLLAALLKDDGVAARLVGGSITLADAVVGADAPAVPLLTHVGLAPFDDSHPAARALRRLVDDPAGFRDDVAAALRGFWNRVFAEEWKTLAPRLDREAARLRRKTVNVSPSAIAERMELPVAIAGDGSVSAKRGAFRASGGEVEGIWILPSAFNVSRLWTAQWRKGRASVLIPLFDPAFALYPAVGGSAEDDLAAGGEPVDAPAVLKALGDSTRYTIASIIARSPATSVTLAGMLDVSKPTISHHLRILRDAGLVNETPTSEGVLLSLRRDAIAGLSASAIADLFESEAEPVVSRSRRQ